MNLRFPMIRERTGRRTGPRYRRVVDCSGLTGSAACAARSLSMAMRYRDQARAEVTPSAAKIARMGMRVMALWARVFVQQISQHDARLDEASNARERAVREYCHACEGMAA